MSDLFDSEEDKAAREAAAAEMSSFLDSLDHSHKSEITLALCVLADLTIFAVGFFFPLWASSLTFEWIVFLVLALFALGFLIGFAGHRVFRSLVFRAPNHETIDGGVMSGYAYAAKRTSEARVWLISAGTGVLNVVLMFLFFDSW